MLGSARVECTAGHWPTLLTVSGVQGSRGPQKCLMLLAVTLFAFIWPYFCENVLCWTGVRGFLWHLWSTCMVRAVGWTGLDGRGRQAKDECHVAGGVCSCFDVRAGCPCRS